MNGIIVINKECGPTSHDIVNKVRKIFATKRVGHLGTLDPDASGVLVICLNDATKLVQFLENDSKEYIAEVLIGFSTDSYDHTGNVLDKTIVSNLTNDDVDKCLYNFLGKVSQIPPIYSAIKKDGKKLYEYAREGKTIEITPRIIEIYTIERISDVVIKDNQATFKIRTHVSKGTYIRSLCFDIAKKLGYPGCMNSLIRIKSGRWKIEDSSKITDVEHGCFKFYSMLDALKNYPQIDEVECIMKAKHGMKISVSKIRGILGRIEQNIVIRENDKLIAIYQFDDQIKCYKAVRVWN